MRALSRALGADRLFVMACSFSIAVGSTIIGALVLTTCALIQTTTIQIPFVAVFHGFLGEGGINAVTVNGSWGGVFGVVLLLAAPLCAVAITYRGGDH